MGAFILLSNSLVSLVAHSKHAAEMAERSSNGNHKNLGNEDVALGFWLRKHGEISNVAPWLNVTYVADNGHIPNLGCHVHAMLYRPPSEKDVAVHFVKSPLGMKYVWDVIYHGMPHNKSLCQKMVGHKI